MRRPPFVSGFAIALLAALPALSFAQSAPDPHEPRVRRGRSRPISPPPSPAAIRTSPSTPPTRRRSGSTRPSRSSSRRSSTTCPASKTVPTPKAVLGDIAGAPTKLPYSKEVYEYMRLLAKASPRVKVFSIGTTEEGREMIAVAVASEAADREARREQGEAREARRSAHDQPGRQGGRADRGGRGAGLLHHRDDSLAGSRRADGADGARVSTRRGREPVHQEHPRQSHHAHHADRRSRRTRSRRRPVQLAHEAPGPDVSRASIYWGQYVAHDNNRDAMGMTLKLTQNVLNTYVDWKAQVLHDLHESVPFLYDNTIGDGPFNAWLDPLLTNEWQMIGWNNVQEMTRLGMPGVFAHGTFDTWSPGYLMFMAATHNGISRLYETFGNGGTAETVERTLSPNETAADVVPAEPAAAAGEVVAPQQQQLRADGRARLAQLLREQPAAVPRELLREEQALDHEGARRRAGGVRAAGRRSSSRRAGRAAARAAEAGGGDLARDGAVHRERRRSRDARGGRGAAAARTAARAGGDSARPAEPTRQTTTRTFPAGSYIVRMDQPYSRIADALLDYQYWSPNDPQKNPYDDTGWTFPEGFSVQAVRVTDAKVLDAPMERVTGEIQLAGRRDRHRHRVRDQPQRATTRSRRCAIGSRRPTSRRPRSRSRPAGKQVRSRVVHRAAACRRRTSTRRRRSSASRCTRWPRRLTSRRIRPAPRASRSCTRGSARRPRAGGVRRSTSCRFRSTTSARRTSRRRRT